MEKLEIIVLFFLQIQLCKKLALDPLTELILKMQDQLLTLQKDYTKRSYSSLTIWTKRLR